MTHAGIDNTRKYTKHNPLICITRHARFLRFNNIIDECESIYNL